MMLSQIQIKNFNLGLAERIFVLEEKPPKDKGKIPFEIKEKDEEEYLNLLEQITSQKWFVKITIAINKDFILENEIALIDSGADLNCIQEGIIPTKYFEKTSQNLSHAGGKNSL